MKSFKEKMMDYLDQAPEDMDYEEQCEWAYKQAEDYFDGYADYLLDQAKDRKLEQL